MISPKANTIKKELLKSKSLEAILNTPIEIQRKQWEDSALDVKLPEDTCMEVVTEKNISAEWITKHKATKQNIIFYFHGGGYNQGSCITHRKLVAHISHHTNLPVLIHNYPLAPENPYPVALDYSFQVYMWLLDRGFKSENIIFGGDSSGGGLALALMLLLKSKSFSMPKGVFLLSPMLDFTLSGNSIKTASQSDPLIFEEDLRLSASYYLKNESPYNPLISPIYGNFEGFPPLLIQVGSDELLLSDSTSLANKAKFAGVDVHLDVWSEMWHVFQAWVDDIPEANLAIEQLGKFTDRILNL